MQVQGEAKAMKKKLIPIILSSNRTVRTPLAWPSRTYLTCPVLTSHTRIVLSAGNDHGQTKSQEFLNARNGRLLAQSKPLEPLTIHFLLKSKHITESVWPRIVRISSPVLTLNTWHREKSVSSLHCVRVVNG